jgi:hypothetical protein
MDREFQAVLPPGGTLLEMRILDGTTDPEGQSFTNGGQPGSRTESLSFSMENSFVLLGRGWKSWAAVVGQVSLAGVEAGNRCGMERLPWRS